MSRNIRRRSSTAEAVPEAPHVVVGANGVAPTEPMSHDGPRLGEMLVSRGLVSPAQLAEALLQQPESGKRLGTLMVELGLVGERMVAEALAEQLTLPFVDLRQEEPDTEAVRRLPEPVARRFLAIPLRQTETTIDIVVADPLDPATRTVISETVTPLRVQFGVSPPTDIRRAIDSTYRALTGVTSLVEAFEATEALRRVDTSSQIVSEDAPVVQVVNLIVTQGVRDRASDVHIEPQGGRVRVRFRIDGALHDVLPLPEAMGPAIVSRLKIMAEMNIVERRRPQDGQLVMEVDGRPVDVRVATSPTIWGEKAVLRLLDRSRTLYRLDELGMSSVTHQRFSRMLHAPYGMVICAGPTGSGKTTTLYATLSEINETERNVTTIEDPVEYVFNSINQIQINEQAGITFAQGLRAILRQDPDVILVGEIRDAETARIAIESALTGHFVLSSIHATDAASSLQRFVDMGIEPFLIASTVSGVVSQRLVRRTCDQCRVPYEPSVEELAFYEEVGARFRTNANGSASSPARARAGVKAGTAVKAVSARSNGKAGGGSEPASGAGGGRKARARFSYGKGCNFCSRTGYQERVGVFELLPMSDEIKALLINSAPLDVLRETAVAEGMETLLQGGIKLIDDDVTTIAEIMRSIYVL